MNYVCCPLLKEDPKNDQLGEVVVFRTIPYITSHLMFLNFSNFLSRTVEFAIGILMCVSIQKRA